MALVNPFGDPIDVVPRNLTNDFRDAFESYTPNVLWIENKAAGDIIQLDGNALSASYLVISKDPLTAGSESSVTCNAVFNISVEAALGLGISQRILGHDFAIELISNEAPIAAVEDIAIANISQTSTTLTVNTISSHNLVPGKRIGIYGVSDSRLNYPALVVASIPAPNQFTCTAGPGGTIGSVTSPSLLTGGNVYFRPAMGYAKNGMSEIFENTTATNASAYVRSNSGDAFPSGTLIGNHSITTITTAGTALATAAYTYAWAPTSEFRLNLQSDRVTFYDATVDSTGITNTRLLRTQVIPDTSKQYKLRVRATNQKGITVPTAKIISAVKSGTAFANITTEGPHGLTANDYIIIYGIRDQTNFATLTTPTKIVDVPSANVINVSFSAAATASSYGGMVARAQGNVAPASYISQAVQSVRVAGDELFLIGSASWSGFSIGDYINVYGVRDSTTGTAIPVDGTYKVANVSGTGLTCTVIGNTTLPAPFGTTNAGGAIIKRSDFRLSYARVHDYTRQRVELGTLKREAISAQPVHIMSSDSNIGVTQVVNARVADITSAAITSTTTTSTITPTAGTLTHEFNVIVTAVSGTNQTLDVVVQESDDAGTNWYDIYHFPRITAVGAYRSPLIPFSGTSIRYVQTVGGASPSFTRSINRLQSPSAGVTQRQFFDRVIALNTANSNTLPYFTDGCSILNAVVSVGNVVITAPNVVLEGSVEGLANTWYRIGQDLQTANNTISYISATDALARFARVRVSSPGNGANLNYVMIKGMGR